MNFSNERLGLRPDVDLPAKAGIYAFHVRSGKLGDRVIDAVLKENHGCLYLGKATVGAGGLHGRIRTHLRTGSTGRSSLRRSLGAALKNRLGIKAIPRPSRKAITRKAITNYAFAEPGDLALTQWMLRALELSFLVDEDPRAAECIWVPKLRPVFDLEGLWSNPAAGYIENQLREACRREAELTGPV